MPLVTATFSTGGNVVINDETEVAALATLTTAVNANTAMLEKLFGPLGSKTPGSLTACASGTVGELFFIHHQLSGLNENIAQLNTAIGKITAELDTGNRGLANINGCLNKQLTTQQAALVDQVKNNQFQQKATNTSLADSGKPPIVVPKQNFVDGMKATIQDIGELKTQVTVAGWVESYITEGITEANVILTKWIVETEIYKGSVALWKDIKLQANTIWASLKISNKANETQASIIAKTRAGISEEPVKTE